MSTCVIYKVEVMVLQVPFKKSPVNVYAAVLDCSLYKLNVAEFFTAAQLGQFALKITILKQNKPLKIG